MKLLAKVEEVFTIEGRGVVVVPTWLSNLKVKAGDYVQLRMPNGQTRNTSIGAVEMVKVLRAPCRAAFILDHSVRKEEVPVGTEIWMSEETWPRSQ